MALPQLTLEHVAATAGVSTATVSRFFNNPSVVSPATAARIQAAVDASGYIPNLMANAMATQRSRLVALLIPSLINSLFDTTIDSLVTQLEAADFSVIVGLTQFSEDLTTQQVRMALQRRAEAIIVSNDLPPDTRAMLNRAETSVIEMWDLPDDPVDLAVGFSHDAIGTALADFAAQRGYVRPRIISSRSSRAMKRHNGFLNRWRALDGAAPTEDIFEGPLHYGAARAAFARIRRLPELPDVVVCGSDRFAQGLIVEANAAGIKVPDQLAIIGFGNTALAGEMRPTITSVDIDGQTMAREMITLLLSRRNKQPIANKCVDVGFKIMVRESA